MRYLSYPRQTVLVTSRASAEIMGKEIEKDNVFTVDWHMPASFVPPLYAISVSKERFSYHLIHKSKAFVVNFMPYELAEKVLFCGRHSGKHMDKFRESGLGKADAHNVDCPVVREALSWIECEVTDEIETGDHVIFIGKIVDQNEVRKAKRPFHVENDIFTTTVD